MDDDRSKYSGQGEGIGNELPGIPPSELPEDGSITRHEATESELSKRPPASKEAVGPQKRPASIISIASTSSKGCRICFDNSSNEPLMNLCDCKGLAGMTHVRCLEKWLSIGNRKECEICLKRYEITTTSRYTISSSIVPYFRENHVARNWRVVFCFFLRLSLIGLSAFLGMKITEERNGGGGGGGFGGGGFHSFVIIVIRNAFAVIFITYALWLLFMTLFTSVYIGATIWAWHDWRKRQVRTTILLTDAPENSSQ